NIELLLGIPVEVADEHAHAAVLIAVPALVGARDARSSFPNRVGQRQRTRRLPQALLSGANQCTGSCANCETRDESGSRHPHHGYRCCRAAVVPAGVGPTRRATSALKSSSPKYVMFSQAWPISSIVRSPQPTH